MSTITDSENAPTTDEARPEGATRHPRIRIPHPRRRLLSAVKFLAQAAEVELQAPTLEQLTCMSDDEFRALRQHICDGMSAALRGAAAPSAAPDIEVQLQNFVAWQQSHPAYYHWPAEAMEALRAKLVEVGPGAELIPCFAMSVQLKLPTGKLILVNRKGLETRS